MRLEKRPERKERKLTRRQFLTILGGVLGLIGGTLIWRRFMRERIKKGPEEITLEDFLMKINEELLEIENNDTRPKEELKLDIEGATFPAKAYLLGNPQLSLDTLWEEKIDYIEQNIKDKKLVFYFRDLKLSLLENFENQPKGYISDLSILRRYIQGCILESLSILDTEKLFSHERYNFDEERRKLILEILNDEDFLNFLYLTILSLILVETCYISKESDRNKKLLSYLLNNYGLKFLAYIPSIYDARLSLGPFQLTDLVVGKEKDKFYPINFMNSFVTQFDKDTREKYKLPEYQLPDSLEKFNIRDHFRAEVYLLLFYLLELFRKIDIEEIKRAYSQNKKWFYYQLCYYLAGCHHLPGISQKHFIEFLRQEENIEKQKSFVDFLRSQKVKGSIVVYLKRFRGNLKGQ